MRLLHASFFTETPTGVANQIHSEIISAKRVGINLTSRVISVSGKGTPAFEVRVPLKHQSRTLRWLEARRKYAKWLVEQQGEFDAILVRWNMADPIFAHALKRINCPVFTIHHTHEPAELRLSAKFGAIRQYIDSYSFKAASKSLSGVISVTKEILDFEQNRSLKNIPGFVYPNGVCYARDPCLRGSVGEQSVPEIAFVASYFSKWQGLDCLLASVHRSNRNFRINIIGRVDEDILLRETDPRLVFHGVLEKKDIDLVFSRCDVGLTAFSIHRKALTQASTLKCREYLMNGLLVYSGHQDIFPSCFPYYKNGKPEIDQILDYAEKNRGVRRAVISEAARPYIDKEIFVRDLFEWVANTISKQ